MERFKLQGDYRNLNLCSTFLAVLMSPFFLSVIYHAIENNYAVSLCPEYFFFLIVNLHLAISDFVNI